MTAARIGAATVLLLAAGYAVGGPAGVFAAAALVAVVALLAARLRIPAGRHRPWALARPGGADQEFASYRRIENALSRARTSRRDFDRSTRPLLQRLAAALLAERRRVDLAKNPCAARAAVGEDVWPLLDPSRPASGDERRPGVSAQTLARIIDRLEDL
jgi:hypothetical protein